MRIEIPISDWKQAIEAAKFENTLPLGELRSAILEIQIGQLRFLFRFSQISDRTTERIVAMD
eukprot:4291903-Pyramimonas_sp.AAC.1